MNRAAYSWVKYWREPFEKIKTALLLRYVYYAGVLRIKYNEDYSTKLIETSHVNNIYDFESYHALNLIFYKPFAPDSNVVYVFFE